MNKKNRKPAIRFKAFNDPWEQREFLSCMDRIIDFRGRTPKKLGLEWSPSGYLALSALNVKDGYIDTAVDAHYANQELYDKWMRGSELKQGQVLFTTEAPMGNVAQVPDNKGYILSQRTIAFVTKDDLILDNFLATVLKSNSVFSKLESLTSGGTAKGISQKSLAKVDLPLPADLTEQQKISNLFLSLNCLITLHQRKLDKLQNVKKACLEKMFPQNGESVPRIRFKGFTDTWEQRKLAEIGDIVTGSTPSTQRPEYYSEDGIPWVTPTDITNAPIKDSQKKLSELGAKVGRVVPAKSILVTCIASIGKNALLEISGSFNQQINALIPNQQKYFPYFLFTESHHWSNKMKRKAAAGTMQIVTKKEFSCIATYVPKLAEQIIIGKLFEELDQLITLHQRKLDKLKNLKKACLEKMFV